MSLAARLAVQQNNNRLTRTYSVITRVADEWNVLGGELDMIGSNTELTPETASVALSSNGRINAFGQTGYTSGVFEDEGRVRVFLYNENANQWQQLGNDIVGTKLSERVGQSVDLSSDGLTMVVASGLDVRIFKYNANTNTWDQYGNTISYKGLQVSISDTGDIIAIANSTQSRVYEVNGVPTWNQKGSDFLGGDAISLSNDGLTVAVGDYAFNNFQGQVKVYTFGADWTQVGNTLVGVTNQQPFNFGSRLGQSVSLSGVGTTLAVGEPRYQTAEYSALSQDPPGRINVYQYNSVSNIWSRLGNGQEMLGGNTSSETGYAVSLSDSGTIIGYNEPGYSDVTVPKILDFKGRFRVFTYNGSTWNEYGTGQYKMIGVTTGRRPEVSSVSMSDDGTTIAISEPTFSLTGSGLTLSYEGRARVLTLSFETIVSRRRMCCSQIPRNNPGVPILEQKSLRVTHPECQSFPISRTKIVRGVNGQATKCAPKSRSCSSGCGSPQSAACGAAPSDINCAISKAPTRTGLRNVSASQVAKLNVKARAEKPRLKKNVCSLWGQDSGRQLHESDIIEQLRSETAASAGIAGTSNAVAADNCRATLFGNVNCFDVGGNVGAIHASTKAHARVCHALDVPPPEPGYVQRQNSKQRLCALRLPTVKRIGPLSGEELARMTADNARRMQRVSWQNNVQCPRPIPISVDLNILTTVTDNPTASILIDGPLTAAGVTALLTKLQDNGGTVIRGLEIGTAVTSIEQYLFNSDVNLVSLTFKDPRNSRCTSIGLAAFATTTGLNGSDLVLPPSITSLEAGAFANIDYNSVTFLGNSGTSPLYGQPAGIPIPVFKSVNNLVNGGQNLNDILQYPSAINTTIGGLGVITRTTDVVFT